MPRIDGQLTGLAGEYFVAAELLRRGLQVSVTLGNAKAIDLFAYEPIGRRTYRVQVKALKKKNYFLIDGMTIDPDEIYVFVLLNTPPAAPEYWVVPGGDLAGKSEKFGKWLRAPKMPGVHPKDLEAYRDGWIVFFQGAG